MYMKIGFEMTEDQVQNRISIEQQLR